MNKNMRFYLNLIFLQISANTATIDGGGLCLFGSQMTLSQSTVINNIAQSGGAAFLDSASSLRESFILTKL